MLNHQSRRNRSKRSVSSQFENNIIFPFTSPRPLIECSSDIDLLINQASDTIDIFAYADGSRKMFWYKKNE